MNEVPIFDSLTHPTIDGNWILPRYINASKFSILVKQMHKSNVRWAFAVGMKDIGNYNQKAFFTHIEKNNLDKFLYPISYLHPKNKTFKQIKNELKLIKQDGFIGLKMHPRISDFEFSVKIANIIKESNQIGLSVLLCTYSYGDSKASKNSPELLMEMLGNCKGAKVMLLHSGSVRLLEYMEIARAFSNVILDLSLTICKYEGSSLDADISFMFKNFDKRICIGSDFPEFSLSKLRERFEYFSNGLSKDKKENIAFRNIFDFIK